MAKKTIIKTDLGNGFVRLQPAAKYNLLAIRLNRFVSEAVVKAEREGDFKAVKK